MNSDDVRPIQCSVMTEIFVTADGVKVIPQYCIAHPYCAGFLHHQRAQMSACTCATQEISLKLSSIAK